MNRSPTERWEVLFSGRVQGVGFRYTCLQTSARYDVTGWVCNLPDGQVKMVVEGSSSQLRAFVDEVGDATHGRVVGRDIQRKSANGEFSRFEIRSDGR